MKKTCIKCDKPHQAHGLCKSHYDEQRRKTKPPCTIEGCSNNIAVVSLGLCNTHYARHRAGKPMDVYKAKIDPNKPICRVLDCERNAHSKGICPTHYSQQRRSGTTFEYKEDEGTEDTNVEKTKTCAWCSKTFYGVSKTVRRGDETLHYQQPCWTKYNQTMKDVVEVLQQK